MSALSAYRSKPRGVAGLTALGVVALLVSALGIGRLPAAPTLTPRPAASAPAAPRACVTRVTLCVVGPARAGSPCSCPHPLRGFVPGRVEMIGGPALTEAGGATGGSRRGEP